MLALHPGERDAIYIPKSFRHQEVLVRVRNVLFEEGADAGGLLERIMEGMRAFSGEAVQMDDQTVVVVEVGE